MKRYIFLLLAVCFSLTIYAQVDRSKAPKAGLAPRVNIGEYQSFTLNNGLKVLVVENHKIPKVTFSLNLVHDPLVEKEKAGYTSVAGELWGKATEKRNAKQLSEDVDFIGANLSTSSENITVSGLSKYTDQLMELFSDVLLHPSFPQEEFDKIILQTQTALKTNETDPQSILDNIRTTTVFGPNHPYGDVVTPTTIGNIKLADCSTYYNDFVHPNHAILVIVGDITLKEAKSMTEKYLSNWKAGEIPTFKYEAPQQPRGREVIFSNKDAAPQASIQVTYPIDFKKDAPDQIAAHVMNQILGGGGFQAKLFKNLREDKGYTYGAYSQLRSDVLDGAGDFEAYGEVKTNIVDSALMEVFKEMKNTATGNYSQEDLNQVKKTMAGSFSRSLESPTTIANFAYSIERYGLPKDYYTNYLSNLEKITKADVDAAARKYIHPENAYVFVVTDRSQKEKLALLDSDGVIVELDHYGKPVKAAPAVSADVTPEKIIDAYIQALGGMDKIQNLKDMTVVSEMNIQGMTLTTTSKYLTDQAQPMFMLEMAMNGNLMQKIIFDGSKAQISGPNGNQTLEGEQIAEFKEQAYPILEAKYAELGIKPTLEGIEKVNDRDAYKLKVSLGNAVTYSFYDVENGLKLKSTGTQNGVTQEVTFEDYRPVTNGPLQPYLSKTSMQGVPVEIKVKDVQVNTGLKTEDFK